MNRQSIVTKSISKTMTTRSDLAPCYVIVTLGGVLFGIAAWLLLPDMLREQLKQYVLLQMQASAETLTPKSAIAQIFQANCIDLLRIYFCGICLLGIPVLILLLFLKCFSIGFVFCILLQHSVLLLFSRLLYIPVVLYAASIAFAFTLELIRNHLHSPIRQLLQYTALFAIIGIAFAVVSVLDGLSSYYYLTNL